jgi:hypothetical protein
VTTAIPLGYPVTMTEDLVYALPGRACLVSVQGSTTIEFSNDNSNWTAITIDTNKNFQTAGGYIRSTGSTAVVTAKPFAA